MEYGEGIGLIDMFYEYMKMATNLIITIIQPPKLMQFLNSTRGMYDL